MTKKSSKRWIEAGPLAVWMMEYCQWLAGHPGAELTGSKSSYRSRHPKVEERVAKASFFAGRRVQTLLISFLEKRPDVREYFGRLRSDTSFHVRELAKQQIVANLDARAQGLTLAIDKEDHREIERYTRPFLDHGFPKKEEKAPPAQKFVINLFGATEEQKKLLLKAVTEEEIDEVEYEIIPTEKTEAEDE